MAARVLNGKDYSEGTTKIIFMLSDLVQDTPIMHKLVYDFIISPLQKKGILNFKFVRWDSDQSSDEDVFDSHFKLVAHILVGYKHVSRGSWSDIPKWYLEEMRWNGVFARKLRNIPD